MCKRKKLWNSKIIGKMETSNFSMVRRCKLGIKLIAKSNSKILVQKLLHDQSLVTLVSFSAVTKPKARIL